MHSMDIGFQELPQKYHTLLSDFTLSQEVELRGSSSIDKMTREIIDGYTMRMPMHEQLTMRKIPYRINWTEFISTTQLPGKSFQIVPY